MPPLEPDVVPPVGIFVTGPDISARHRWIGRELNVPGRHALLTAELSGAELGRFRHEHPTTGLRRLFLPCACCPSLAHLPMNARELVAAVGPERLFIDLPLLAVTGLISEFDEVLRWPRQLVVCLSPAWAVARARHELTPFQFGLLSQADLVVAPEAEMRAR